MKKTEIATEKMLELITTLQRYRAKYNKHNSLNKAKEDISERQIKILITLYLYDKNTVSEMAKFMNISKSTLSIILSKMIKKNIICKEFPDGFDDKRKVYFKITELGQDKLREIGEALTDNFKVIYEQFSDERKKNFSEGISRLAFTINSSKPNLYQTIINSDYYKERLQNTDEVSQMAFKLFMFFVCFIEYFQAVLSSKSSVNDEFSSLTRNRYHILQCVSVLNLNTVSKLEEYLCASGSSVSIAVSRLTKDGYLFKEHPNIDEDGRVVYIRLTEKGKEIIRKAKENVEYVLETYFAKFDDEDLESTVKSFEYLLKAFEITEN